MAYNSHADRQWPTTASQTNHHMMAYNSHADRWWPMTANAGRWQLYIFFLFFSWLCTNYYSPLDHVYGMESSRRHHPWRVWPPSMMMHPPPWSTTLGRTGLRRDARHITDSEDEEEGDAKEVDTWSDRSFPICSTNPCHRTIQYFVSAIVVITAIKRSPG